MKDALTEKIKDLQDSRDYWKWEWELMEAAERKTEEIISKLNEEIWHLKNAMKADDERLEAAAKKAGIEYFGCDTADVMADMIIELRAKS